MFLETKTEGEVTTKLKLSEAIRKGLAITQREEKNWRFCALGAAFAGVRGRLMSLDESTDFVFADAHISGHSTARAIGKALGFREDLCLMVSAHHNLGMPAAKIADWLEAQGY